MKMGTMDRLGDPSSIPNLGYRDDRPAEAHMPYGLGDIRMRGVFIEQEEGGGIG